MTSNPDFIILPFDVLIDGRLSLRQIRVLMAILSWRKKSTNLAAISREMIADRTGYPLSRISTITSELETLGWIKKVGNGGRSKWIRYQIAEANFNKDNQAKDNQNSNPLNDKETVTKTVTVTNSETVTDSDLNGYQNGNETVTESGTRIDTERITDKDTDKKINKKRTAITIADLKKISVDEQIAIEFLELRKQKKARLTPIALAGIQREADKAGISLNDALRTCIERGWQGFNADWIAQSKIPASKSEQRTAWNQQLDRAIAKHEKKEIYMGVIDAGC